MECSFVVFIFTAETVSSFEGKQALNDHHHHKHHLILLVAAMTIKTKPAYTFFVSKLPYLVLKHQQSLETVNKPSILAVQ